MDITNHLLLERFDVVGGPPLHFSDTACVLKAKCLAEEENKQDQEQSSDDDIVALKCMYNYNQVMAELDGRVMLNDTDAVLKIRMVYVDSSIESDLLSKLKKAADACNAKIYVQDDIQASVSNIIKDKRNDVLENHYKDRPKDFKFMLVFDFAERTLATSLKHDQIFDNAFAVKSILRSIIENVAQLHKKNIIHADLKPLNIVRVGSKWKLIDLDASCKIGDLFGSKMPSSGHCPPEVVTLMNSDNGLKHYPANIALDIWSIGVLMFHLCAGATLLHIDENGNLISSAKKNIDKWNRKALESRLEEIPNEHGQVGKLLKKLLDVDPDKRKEHFENDVLKILKDPFFSKEGAEPVSSIPVASNQFLANCDTIDLPKSGTVTQSVAETVCEIVLHGARNGSGERQPCKGMIVIVGSVEQFIKHGYVQGTNKFEDQNINVADWEDQKEFILSCFQQDLGMFVDGTTGKILADHYKVDLLTRDADHNGGSKHVSASAIGMTGCLAIKCSEDCCLADGKGKEKLKIFSGTRLPKNVEVKPNGNYF